MTDREAHRRPLMTPPTPSGAPPLRVAYVLLRPSYSETFIGSEIRAVQAAGAEVEIFEVGHRRRERLITLASASLTRARATIAHARGLGASYGARALLAGSTASALAGRVRRFAPDVLHAHFVNLPAAVAIRIACELGRPVTATAHAADFMLDRRRAALNRRIGQLSHLFVISSATAQQLRERGVDLGGVPYSVVRAAFDGVYREAPIPAQGGPTRLITVARLVEKKGVDTAIDAVALLRAAGHVVRYDVYGGGPMLELLRQRVMTLGLDGVVRLYGATPHGEAMAALERADVALLPCREATDGDLDGIPVFLMEAASRGVPVVTTPVSGIPDLVSPERGWLVPPADPASLAAVVAKIVTDDPGARKHAATLREHLRAEFAPELQAARLLRTWHHLTRRSPSP